MGIVEENLGASRLLPLACLPASWLPGLFLPPSPTLNWADLGPKLLGSEELWESRENLGLELLGLEFFV